ncbi:MAG TPA: hypothetical protein EYN66_02825, partial [Myxococcales bacterium]|nr:hypothetical protein [Myxococcales bacterium]
PCIEAMACVPETNKCTVALYKLACPEGSICHAEEGPDGPGKLTCVPLFETLCMPCNTHKDCEDPLFENETQLCIPTTNGKGSFCGTDCSTHACPPGYKCTSTMTDTGSTVEQCVPEEGTGCDCQPQWSALLKWTDCESSNSYGNCKGKRICTPQGLSSCDAKTPSPEICDGLDNNCNGTADEGTETLCGEPGACCMKDGGCQGLFEQSCANQEGGFQGIGVLCAQAACGGNIQGACCLPNQSCALLQYNQCQNAGGSYKGDGMNCNDIDCTIPNPIGACCHVNASCAEFTALSCIQQQGYFQGNDVKCNDITCTTMGACCLPNGQCKLVSKTACTALGGNWNKNFICSDVACLPGDGMGACCLEGGGCAVLQPEECTSQSGDFLTGENCFGQCGGAELGACCYINGDCAQTASSSCPVNATWKGQNSTCGNGTCGDSGTGACCAIGACYEGFTAAECALLPGEYQGNDTTCEVCK